MADRTETAILPTNSRHQAGVRISYSLYGEALANGLCGAMARMQPTLLLLTYFCVEHDATKLSIAIGDAKGQVFTHHEAWVWKFMRVRRFVEARVPSYLNLCLPHLKRRINDVVKHYIPRPKPTMWITVSDSSLEILGSHGKGICGI